MRLFFLPNRTCVRDNPCAPLTTHLAVRLYRRILRAHRHLPYEMRSLGDDYVKAGNSVHSNACLKSLTSHDVEFRRHKEITNKVHIIGFLSQWKVYLDELPSGPDAERFSGKKLDPTVLEKASSLRAAISLC